jgi:hypothetical protein
MWESLRNFSTEEIKTIMQISQIAILEDINTDLLKDLKISYEDYKCLQIKINNFVESL